MLVVVNVHLVELEEVAAHGVLAFFVGLHGLCQVPGRFGGAACVQDTAGRFLQTAGEPDFQTPAQPPISRLVSAQASENPRIQTPAQPLNSEQLSGIHELRLVSENSSDCITKGK